MDTSETYIKMSDKARKYLPKVKEYKDGDWLYDLKDKDIHVVGIHFHYPTPNHVQLLLTENG